MRQDALKREIALQRERLDALRRTNEAREAKLQDVTVKLEEEQKRASTLEVRGRPARHFRLEFHATTRRLPATQHTTHPYHAIYATSPRYAYVVLVCLSSQEAVQLLTSDYVEEVEKHRQLAEKFREVEARNAQLLQILSQTQDQLTGAIARGVEERARTALLRLEV